MCVSWPLSAFTSFASALFDRWSIASLIAMMSHSDPGFASYGFTIGQGDTRMCIYYADQATQHELRQPHGASSHKRATYWQATKARHQIKLGQAQAQTSPAPPPGVTPAAQEPPAGSSGLSKPGRRCRRGPSDQSLRYAVVCAAGRVQSTGCEFNSPWQLGAWARLWAHWAHELP